MFCKCKIYKADYQTLIVLKFSTRVKNAAKINV